MKNLSVLFIVACVSVCADAQQAQKGEPSAAHINCTESPLVELPNSRTFCERTLGGKTTYTILECTESGCELTDISEAEFTRRTEAESKVENKVAHIWEAGTADLVRSMIRERCDPLMPGRSLSYVVALCPKLDSMSLEQLEAVQKEIAGIDEADAEHQFKEAQARAVQAEREFQNTLNETNKTDADKRAEQKAAKKAAKEKKSGVESRN